MCSDELQRRATLQEQVEQEGEFGPLEEFIHIDIGVNGLENFRCPALRFAVARDNSEAALMLLANGADPDVRDGDGRTPLHLATSARMVRLLLSWRADPEARDVVGWTPLHKVARRGNLAATLALIRHGVQIDARDHEGITPLHKATMRGHDEIVRLLLANGADRLARDNAGNTPEAWALAIEHE